MRKKGIAVIHAIFKKDGKKRKTFVENLILDRNKLNLENIDGKRT